MLTLGVRQFPGLVLLAAVLAGCSQPPSFDDGLSDPSLGLRLSSVYVGNLSSRTYKVRLLIGEDVPKWGLNAHQAFVRVYLEDSVAHLDEVSTSFGRISAITQIRRPLETRESAPSVLDIELRKHTGQSWPSHLWVHFMSSGKLQKIRVDAWAGAPQAASSYSNVSEELRRLLEPIPKPLPVDLKFYYFPGHRFERNDAFEGRVLEQIVFDRSGALIGTLLAVPAGAESSSWPQLDLPVLRLDRESNEFRPLQPRG
jgi:hypothetical protein